MSKWLQNHGFEQLMELSSNLFSVVLHDVTMTDETVGLVNPFLQMIVSVLKFSQKREICQSHFTLSIQGLYQIFQAGSVCNQVTKGINPDLSLEAILMSAPPTSIFLMVLSFIPFLYSFLVQNCAIIYKYGCQRYRSNQFWIVFDILLDF